MIRAIIACDEHDGIGKQGTLPWPSNKEDLKWFKQMTNGSTVIMGYNTWKDPKMPKPLPNRYNIVVTSKYIVEGPNAIVHPERLEQVLEGLNADIWLIGGATLFERFLPLAEELCISRIEGDWKCDTFMPPYKHLYANTHILKQNGLTIETWY